MYFIYIYIYFPIWIQFQEYLRFAQNSCTHIISHYINWFKETNSRYNLAKSFKDKEYDKIACWMYAVIELSICIYNKSN